MKLAGFLVLLAAIFVAAHAAGARLGPVTTGHSQVQYPADGASTAAGHGRHEHGRQPVTGHGTARRQRRGRAGGHRDDLRLVRGPDRAAAEPA